MKKIAALIAALAAAGFTGSALADPPPLQHDVLAAALLQHRTHGQAGLAASDDDGVVLLSHA